MLEYVKSAVTRNQSEKKINSLLDYIANSTNTNLLQSFYSTTLERLAEAKNERLWFKTQLKLCTLWFQMKEYSKATKLMKELHRQDFGFSNYIKTTTRVHPYIPSLKKQHHSQDIIARSISFEPSPCWDEHACLH